MRNLLNKPWFAAVLAVAAIAFVAHALLSDGKGFAGGVFHSDEPAVEVEGTAMTGATSVVAALKSLPVPSAVRDPFALRPKAETVEKIVEPDLVETVHLSALWTQDGQTLVVINNRIFQGGDAIGRLKIESANADGVWLTHWKGRDFVAVGQDFTLNTPAAQANLAGAL